MNYLLFFSFLCFLVLVKVVGEDFFGVVEVIGDVFGFKIGDWVFGVIFFFF